MKKGLLVVLALIMVLGLVGCSSSTPSEETNTAELTETTPIETESQTPEPTPTKIPSSWAFDYAVDDFGDPTDEKLMKAIFSGSFSNTATVDGALNVVIFYRNISNNPMEGTGYFDIRLLEYNDSPATYLSNDTITLKVKINSEIYTQELLGKAPNGDFTMLFNAASVGYVDGNRSLGQLISNELWEGREVPCIIEIGSSKYSFTLSGDGFAELYDEWRESLDN